MAYASSDRGARDLSGFRLGYAKVSPGYGEVCLDAGPWLCEAL